MFSARLGRSWRDEWWGVTKEPGWVADHTLRLMYKPGKAHGEMESDGARSTLRTGKTISNVQFFEMDHEK
jgi:hypothetical protein